MTSLSIIMPVFNESATVVRAIDRVLAVDYPCSVELVVVDDGSTDETTKLLGRRHNDRRLTVVHHGVNRGKGAAVLTGVARATGTHVIVVDGDLEYDPSDIPSMLGPVLSGIADHVYGVRIFGFNTRFPSYRFAKGGRFTTAVANVLFDSCLTDMHTCLKLIPRKDLEALPLSRSGFALDTELTARILHAGIRPFEVPISYNGRTASQGKKITWRDGLDCLHILFKVRMSRPDILQTGPFHSSGVVVPMTLPHADGFREADGKITSAAT
jgi:dolichol-phosphate hexosyltransferase